METKTKKTKKVIQILVCTQEKKSKFFLQDMKMGKPQEKYFQF